MTCYIIHAMNQSFLIDWLILIIWSAIISRSPTMYSWPSIDYVFVSPFIMIIASILPRFIYLEVYKSRSLFLMFSIKPSLIKAQLYSASILLDINFKASACLLIPLVLHSRQHLAESKLLPINTSKKARLLSKIMNTMSVRGLAQSWKRYSMVGDGLSHLNKEMIIPVISQI